MRYGNSPWLQVQHTLCRLALDYEIRMQKRFTAKLERDGASRVIYRHLPKIIISKPDLDN
jgi:hypothetical protein